ncbi:MAG: hypothetical protein AAF572_10910 [Cyanobacteria bacterium P01_B01_bin.77]
MKTLNNNFHIDSLKADSTAVNMGETIEGHSIGMQSYHEHAPTQSVFLTAQIAAQKIR